MQQITDSNDKVHLILESSGKSETPHGTVNVHLTRDKAFDSDEPQAWAAWHVLAETWLKKNNGERHVRGFGDFQDEAAARAKFQAILAQLTK